MQIYCTVAAIRYPSGFLQPNGNLLLESNWLKIDLEKKYQYSLSLPHWNWQVKRFIARIGDKVNDEARSRSTQYATQWDHFSICSIAFT